MHTHETEPEAPGLGTSAKSVAEHASTLVRLELELAALELKRKATRLGVGVGLLLTAALLMLYALGFGLAAAAAGIATALPWWAALLIVTGAIVLVAAILGLIGVNSVQKGTPPVPEQAIEEAKLTTEALKGNGRH
ncbi:MAG TPA: phage holin family protein [Gaiellaceae bacterium]|nr:phage holin family protein [Gaiellaceae bacterium]